jgi:hypothetical protein
MLGKKLHVKNMQLVPMVLITAIAGYYIYLHVLAATETVTRNGCETLQKESGWRLDGKKCVGPNGVVLTVSG